MNFVLGKASLASSCLNWAFIFYFHLTPCSDNVNQTKILYSQKLTFSGANIALLSEKKCLPRFTVGLAIGSRSHIQIAVFSMSLLIALCMSNFCCWDCPAIVKNADFVHSYYIDCQVKIISRLYIIQLPRVLFDFDIILI